MDLDPEVFGYNVKLQHLEPLKPLDISKTIGTKSLKPKDSFKDLVPINPNLISPINVFGDSNSSEGFEVGTTSKVNKSPRSIYGSVDGRMNPLHYKTRDMCKDYNSLMNSLYPKESSLMTEEVSKEDSSEDPSSVAPTVPVISVLHLNRTNELKECSKLSGVSELKECSKLETLCQELEMKHNIESKIMYSLEPKAKDYELEDAIIESLPYSKKKCLVWWEGETIPYSKFRENSENILFFVGEDAYGYSKKSLYEEYIKEFTYPRSGTLKHDVKNRVYFDLDLNWEDGEILWVPMSQILRILEFSHPVYELQKTKFSNKVWNAIPVKLQK
jgi:hypothetical protein